MSPYLMVIASLVTRLTGELALNLAENLQGPSVRHGRAWHPGHVAVLVIELRRERGGPALIERGIALCLPAFPTHSRIESLLRESSRLRPLDGRFAVPLVGIGLSI